MAMQSKPHQSTKPGEKPGQPNGPANKPQSYVQADQASQTLPPELAKLGLTPADWAKLKGLISGAQGNEGDRVPAEYRELVKGYFQALSRESK